jgi:hypothetical protein
MSTLNNSDYDPYEDTQCIAFFCEERSDDFDLWFAEHANHPAKKEHYELAYCESHEHAFLEFACRYHESDLQDQADRLNDSIQDR